MTASRTVYELCGPLMDDDDKVTVKLAYKLARHAKEELNASGVSGIQGFRKARQFRRLSKVAYRTTKGASDRALDGIILGSSDETDPPAGAPPTTPEEPDRPPPHDSQAAATNTIGERAQDAEMTTPSPGAAGIGGPMDEDHWHETYSFIYDPDLASSEISIASYKTERTVNSRKSRYNVLPRRKHPDSGHLGVPQGIVSSDVDDASVQGFLTTEPPPGPFPDHRMTGREQEGESQIDSLTDIFGTESEAGVNDEQR
ncbi:hypothetical protein BJY52DRAFT_1316590 [Lactarius psammicola]|nr:hypothetical protein BJY52DRAFT_1316590 [Lactarius psammicola]